MLEPRVKEYTEIKHYSALSTSRAQENGMVSAKSEM